MDDSVIIRVMRRNMSRIVSVDGNKPVLAVKEGPIRQLISADGDLPTRREESLPPAINRQGAGRKSVHGTAKHPVLMSDGPHFSSVNLNCHVMCKDERMNVGTSSAACEQQVFFLQNERVREIGRRKDDALSPFNGLF